MNFLNLLDAAASNANGQQQATSFGALLGTFLPLILMFVVVYFFMIRPQKKRDKQIQDLRSNRQIGDEVITTGGIIGIIAGIKEDTVLIETGSDRSKIRLARWAIAQNNTVHEEA